MVESDDIKDLKNGFSLKTGEFGQLRNFLLSDLFERSQDLLDKEGIIPEKHRSKEYSIVVGDLYLGNYYINHRGLLNKENYNQLSKTIKKIVNKASDTDLKISKKIAKIRGLDQVKAGGEFEIDRDISNFSDLLASLEVKKVKFIESNKFNPEKFDSRKNVVDEETKSNNKEDNSGSLPPGNVEKFLNFTDNRNLLIAGATIVVYMVIKK